MTRRRPLAAPLLTLALALLLALTAACAAETAPTERLEAALIGFEGRFEWDPARRDHVFSDRPGLAALLEPAPEARLADLAACIDDPRPARATLDGAAVPLGALCLQAIRLVAYVEAPDWPGHIGPLATPAERWAARRAWQKAIAEGGYVLH